MRAIGAALFGVLCTFAACTQDFDQFHVGESGGSAGAAASAGIGGSSAGGTGGTEDASIDGEGGTAGVPADAGDAGADGGCPAGRKDCGGSCVPDDDPAYGCMAPSCTPCSFANATAVCDTTGQCALDECSSGHSDCNGQSSDGCEAQPATDPDNCGSCGTACVVPNATASCAAGQCGVAACDSGYANCDTDVVNGCEVNTGSDPEACGSCSNDCTLQPGTWVCNNGTCAVSQCPNGKGDCDGNPGTVCETNVDTSLQHCGFCNNPCNLANATAKCTAGQCAIDACDPGFADCDGNPSNGCEIDLSKSALHCGACNRGCSTANAGTVACSAGVCTSTCSPGFGNCTQPQAPAADDGCESNLLSDTADCGACGRACSNTQTGIVSCSAGKCDSTCKAGFGNCSMPLAPMADDGCETNVASDTTNCGGCGRACSTNNVLTAACSAGLCTSLCSAGFGNCTTPAAPAIDDGCEVNTASNVNHCGACNRVCSSSNVAAKSCTAGVCTSTCNAGSSNCTQPLAPALDNGCETDTAGDPSNCGGCGRACAVTNVQAQACAGGLCTSTCQNGFGNCALPGAPLVDDGCETNTATSTANCGACGRACSSVGVSALSCASGVCNSTCTGTLGNCTQPAAPAADDGCESNIATNVAHCGACGRACSAANVTSLSCSAGLCTSYCALGFANCAQPVAPTADNGCELDVKNTDATCGSCTNSCVAQNGMVCGDGSIPDSTCGCGSDADCQTGGDDGTCSNGICVCPGSPSETCRAGEVCVKSGIINHDCSCNGGAACATGQVCCQTPAGCFNLTNNAANCGACGRACPPLFACSAGGCVCSGNASCDAGGGGTCTAGACVCGTTTCPAGKRCLPGGVCG